MREYNLVAPSFGHWIFGASLPPGVANTAALAPWLGERRLEIANWAKSGNLNYYIGT